MLLGAVACGSEPEAPEQDTTPNNNVSEKGTQDDRVQENASSIVVQSDLVGRTFYLHLANGFTPADNSRISIGFFADWVSLRAGCNGMGGEYQIDHGTLIVSSIMSTDMGCDDGLPQQEDWFREFIGSGPTVDIDGDWLKLTSGTTELTFLDRLVADPDRPLTGTLWNISSLLMGGQFARSVVLESNPSVVFSPDGTFRLSSGCNLGEGEYDATATQLSFGMLSPGVLDGECHAGGQDGKEQWQFIMQVFSGTANYDIWATHLTIEHDDRNGITAGTESLP